MRAILLGFWPSPGSRGQFAAPVRCGRARSARYPVTVYADRCDLETAVGPLTGRLNPVGIAEGTDPDSVELSISRKSASTTTRRRPPCRGPVSGDEPDEIACAGGFHPRRCRAATHPRVEGDAQVAHARRPTAPPAKVRLHQARQWREVASVTAGPGASSFPVANRGHARNVTGNWMIGHRAP